MTKEDTERLIKHILHDSIAEMDDTNKSYWFIMQIMVELILDYIHSGFEDKNKRIEIMKELSEGMIQHIKEYKDDIG